MMAMYISTKYCNMYVLLCSISEPYIEPALATFMSLKYDSVYASQYILIPAQVRPHILTQNVWYVHVSMSAIYS